MNDKAIEYILQQYELGKDSDKIYADLVFNPMFKLEKNVAKKLIEETLKKKDPGIETTFQERNPVIITPSVDIQSPSETFDSQLPEEKPEEEGETDIPIISGLADFAEGIPVLGGLFDFAEDFSRAFGSGVTQGTAGVDALEAAFGKAEDDDLQEIVDAMIAQDQIGLSDEAIALQKQIDELYANGGSSFDAFLLRGTSFDNFSASLEILGNSLGLMLGAAVDDYGKNTLGALGVGATTSAAIAAPVGAVAALNPAGAVSGPAAFGGAFLTTLPKTTMGAFSGIIDAEATIMEIAREELMSANKEINVENLRAVFEDPEIRSRMQSKAAARGIAIGLIDAATMAGTGKAVSGLAKAGVSTSKRFAVATTGEVLGGSVGEATAQLVTEGELNWDEVLMEGVAEGPMSLVTYATTKQSQYRLNGQLVSLEEFNNYLNSGERLQSFEVTGDAEVKDRANKIKKAQKTSVDEVEQMLQEEAAKRGIKLFGPSLTRAVGHAFKKVQDAKNSNNKTDINKAISSAVDFVQQRNKKDIYDLNASEESSGSRGRTMGSSKYDSQGSVADKLLKRAAQIREEAKQKNPSERKSLLQVAESLEVQAEEIISERSEVYRILSVINPQLADKIQQLDLQARNIEERLKKADISPELRESLEQTLKDVVGERVNLEASIDISSEVDANEVTADYSQEIQTRNDNIESEISDLQGTIETLQEELSTENADPDALDAANARMEDLLEERAELQDALSEYNAAKENLSNLSEDIGGEGSIDSINAIDKANERLAEAKQAIADILGIDTTTIEEVQADLNETAEAVEGATETETTETESTSERTNEADQSNIDTSDIEEENTKTEVIGKVPDEFGGGDIKRTSTTTVPEAAQKTPRSKDNNPAWREGMADGQITASQARALNNLQKLLDKLGIEIYIYSTPEAAAKYKDGNWGGLYSGGAVHINLSQINESQKLESESGFRRTKSFEETLQEEVMHGIIGPIFSGAFKNNPKAAAKFRNQLNKILNKNKDLKDRVEAKEKTYRDAGKSEDVIFEEIIIEVLSAIAGGTEAVNTGTLDQIRVLINNILKTAGISYRIQSTNDLINFANKFKDAQEGKNVNLESEINAAQSERAKAGQRGAADIDASKDRTSSMISPAKIPTNEDGTVTVKIFKEGYRKLDDGFRKAIGAFPEDRTFNDQWHFINWWRRVAKNNSDYVSFYTKDDTPIDVERINRYRSSERESLALTPAESDIKEINRMVSAAQSQGILDPIVAKTIRLKIRSKSNKFRYFNERGLTAEKEQYSKNQKPVVAEFKTFVEGIIDKNAKDRNIDFNFRGDDDVRNSILLSREILNTDANSKINYGKVGDLLGKITGIKPKTRVQTYDFLRGELEKRFTNTNDAVAHYSSLLGGIIADPQLRSDMFGEENPIEFFTSYQKEAESLIDKLLADGDITGDRVDNLAKLNYFIALLSAKNQSSTNINAAVTLLKDSEKFKINDPLGISKDFIRKVRTGKIEGVSNLARHAIARGLEKLIAVVNNDVASIEGMPSTIVDNLKQGSSFIKDGAVDWMGLTEFLLSPYEGSRVKIQGDVVSQQIFGPKIGAWLLNMNQGLFPQMSVDGKRLSDVITIDTHVLNTSALVLGGYVDAGAAAGYHAQKINRLKQEYGAPQNELLTEVQFDKIERARAALSTPEEARSKRQNTLINDAGRIIREQVLWCQKTIEFLQVEGRDKEARRIERALDNIINPVVSESMRLKRESRKVVESIRQSLNDTFGTELTNSQVGQLMFADRQAFSFKLFNDDGTVNTNSLDYKTYANSLKGLSSVDQRPSASNDNMSASYMISPLEKMQKADESPLYRARTASEVLLMKNGRRINNREVNEALRSDAVSRRILEKNNFVENDQKVGVRLNLNVLKNTGVPVQTIHDKTATGEALLYAPSVVLKNVKLNVNQNARNKIVTFQENKFPMASVDGSFVTTNLDEQNYNGVKAFFNPFKHNVFVDASGRPIKSASEATVVGNNVYLRGDIEYYSFDDPILDKGRVESAEQNAKRIKRGPKYDKGLKRFVMWSKSQGVEFVNNLEAEAAYDNMPIPSLVALNESEVVNNMEEAQDRASMMLKLRATAGRGARTYSSVRDQIINNPSNYFTPQKLEEIKDNLTNKSDQDLVEMMSGEGLSNLQNRNDDLGVLAVSELINRAVAAGNMDAIPGLINQASQIGTTVGRIMRHLRELKSSTPVSIVQTIVKAVEANGNRLSADQMTRLEGISGELFRLQAEHESLTKRAIAGENVDAELNAKTKELKLVERSLDTFANAVIERGWGQIGTMLIQGNLLTPMSQITNVGANLVNAIGKVGVDIIALPIEKLINAFGIESPMKRNYSINAYMYGIRKFGTGFVEALDSIVTGQESDVTEWRIHRGFAPFRSLMSAMGKGDLPLGPDGKASLSQRIKLGVQGTLGIPAETMFRFLSLGDTPFRRYVEGMELYRAGLNMGLEGDALIDFMKHPNKKALDAAQREGRKLTFQEQTTLSNVAENVTKTFEDIMASALTWLPGVDGKAFAKFMIRSNLPYLRTPANILMETLTYVSPYVAVPRIMKKLQEGNAREAAENFGKLTLGTMAAQTATILVKEGLISGNIEWDEDEERNIAYDQFPPNSINVSGLKRWLKGEDTSHQNDDYFISYNKLGVLGAIMGATAKSSNREDLKSRDYSETSFALHAVQDAFGVGAFSSMSYMMDQSFMQGMNTLINVISSADASDFERNFENWSRTTFQAVSATALPNTLSALYRGNREFLPDTRTTKDASLTDRILQRMNYTIKERTFGLSGVPVRINWKGEPIRQTPRGTTGMLYNLFDITKARQGEDDPVSNEIYRLYEQTYQLTKAVGTPGYAEKRKLNVPNVGSKQIRMLNRMGLNYSWMNDQEFMAERLYLNTDQMNRLMAASGKERYAELEMLMSTPEYQSMTDQQKIEALDEINENYNSAIEMKGGKFKNHTLVLFEIMQEIYENER